MVDETGREFYRVCNEFDLGYAWEDEWVRENVLKPLHAELCRGVSTYGKTYHHDLFESFTRRSLKNLLNWYGKTRAQIAGDLREFLYGPALVDYDELYGREPVDTLAKFWLEENRYELVGYYTDYDHVLLASLFGRMIDLPKGLPMFTTDLRQKEEELEAKIKQRFIHVLRDGLLIQELYPDVDVNEPLVVGKQYFRYFSVAAKAGDEPDTKRASGLITFPMGTYISEWGNAPLQTHQNYPVNTQEHNALADAKWNRALDQFLSV
ncbi:hypothetical protein [Fibrella aestuarina]